MVTKPLYFLIMVLDIEMFGRRTNPLQAWLRERLSDVVQVALKEAQIPPDHLEAYGDRGDGGFWLFRSSVSKLDLTGRFIDCLQAQLRRHAQFSNDDAALRLRVALHAGDVGRDDRGWVGEDLNTACRLVDLDALKDSLASAHRSGLALAVTDEWYSSVLQHDYPELHASEYRQVPFESKEVTSTAWLRVPGYDIPPGLGHRAASEAPELPKGPGAAARPRKPSEPAPAESGSSAPGPGSYSGRFAGARIAADQVYGGDHFEGVSEAVAGPYRDARDQDRDERGQDG